MMDTSKHKVVVMNRCKFKKVNIRTGLQLAEWSRSEPKSRIVKFLCLPNFIQMK